MKYICFMIDGAADSQLKELDGKTPLESAKTPVLDHMCAHGELGLVKCIPDGAVAGTETALIEVFGSSAAKPGRAYLEAPGFDITIANDEQALRANIITVSDDGKILSHCSGDLSSEEAFELLDSLRNDPELSAEMKSMGLRLMNGEAFRHVWAIKTSAELPKCYPPHEHIGEAYEDIMPDGWADIMLKTHSVLSKHSINRKRREAGKFEANMIWPWGEGERVVLPSFFDRTGLKGACIAGAAVVKGAGRLSGMKVVDDPSFTADFETNWRGKAEACLKELNGCDAVFLHLESPDESAHSGNIDEKCLSIEIADEMIGIIMDGLKDKDSARFMMFADHYTYSDTRKHGSKPTPYLLYDSSAELPAKKQRFTEADAKDKATINGKDLCLLLAKK